MDRIKTVQAILDHYIEKSADKKKYYVHSYGVAGFAAVLAVKRSIDPELASVIGLLHDIYAVETGSYENHDILGSRMAEQILLDTGLFTTEEIDTVKLSIERHDNRQDVDGRYDEVLKDADILQPYLQSLAKPHNQVSELRLNKILKELGL